MSVNFRIFFDYVQMISIIQNIKFQWPVNLNNYFNVFSYLSFTTQIFSFDCIIFDYGITFSSVYIKLLFVEIMPFFICSTFLSVIWLFGWKKQSKDIKVIKSIVVIFVVFTYSQISTISKLFDIISCIEINNSSYLASDFRFVCWTQEHKLWVKILILNIKKIFF